VDLESADISDCVKYAAAACDRAIGGSLAIKKSALRLRAGIAERKLHSNRLIFNATSDAMASRSGSILTQAVAGSHAEPRL